ncbi:MAG: succinate dehydrogenase assembly factor 2 [Gammaproteobacteria bacterium]|jgi:antitoxin CptB|nr:succinate dehydrogenase assembly factor 2 [Gammaproteobacteria bacterium]
MDADLGRLRWRSRRGMLELDVLLERFLKRHGEQLDSRDRAAYARLLECADEDLHAWFSGRMECPHAEFSELIRRVRAG